MRKPEGKTESRPTRRSRTRLRAFALGLALVALLSSGATRQSASADAVVKTAARPELVLQTGHAYRVDAPAFSPDGRPPAPGDAEGAVKVWDVATGREARALAGAHAQQVTALAFSADGRLLASGGKDNAVRLWEVSTGRGLHTLAGHTGLIKSLAF